MTADRLVPPSTTEGGTAASGDCFVVAATLAMRLAGMGQRVRLVHAVITGQAQIEGVAHWHAWVEFPTREVRNGFKVTTWWALDQSNGKNVRMPADAFRALARVQLVDEYTPEQARDWMLRTEVYGPWQHDDGIVS